MIILIGIKFAEGYLNYRFEFYLMSSELAERLSHVNDIVAGVWNQVFKQRPSYTIELPTPFALRFLGQLNYAGIAPNHESPLIAVLGYISQTSNAFLGGIILFCMGIGMGFPLLLIGAVGPKILPKTGSWRQLSIRRGRCKKKQSWRRTLA